MSHYTNGEVAQVVSIAITAERERCAKIAETFLEAVGDDGEPGEVYIARKIVDAIRTQSNEEK